MCVFFPQNMEMSALLALVFSYKKFSTSENVFDSVTSSVFQTLVIIQLANARLFCYEGKVKTGRLQSVIGHVATPPQGVGSTWGKDLAPPERPGVRADRAVPGAETDTQRPLSLVYLRPRLRYPTPSNNR